MPLLERLKDAVGVSQDSITYRYHCRECDSEFETPEKSLKAIDCPNCGASGSRHISRM